MKKKFTKFFAAFLAVMCTLSAQTQLYEFPFNGSLSATVGTGTFSGSGASYITDRNGVTGNALSSNGGTISAPLTGLPSGNSARTISLWFNRQGGGNVGMFSYGGAGSLGRFGVGVDVAGRLTFQVTAGGIDSTIVITGVTFNAWHNLVLTHDGTFTKVYFNGRLGATFRVNLNTVAGDYAFGSMVGYYDDLKIYNYALCPSDITSISLIYDFPFDNRSYSSVVGTGSFDNTATVTAGRNGTVNGAIWTNRAQATAATLSGNLPIGANSRTIAFWFNRQGAANRGLFRYGTNANLRVFGAFFDPSGNLAFQGFGSGNDQLLSIPTLRTNTWHHLALTYDGTNVRVYFDGVLNTTFARNLDTGNSSFELGPVDAYFDDLKIYTRALDASEIIVLAGRFPITQQPISVTRCAGLPTTLRVTAPTAISYQWQLNGVDIPNANASSYTANGSYASAGIYRVSMSDGCFSGLSNNATLTYSPSLAVITASNNVLTAPAGFSYRWLNSGSVIPNATSSTYIVTQNGTYSVEVTDFNGCWTISAPIVVTTVGIETLESIGVSVFPNPTEGVLFISSTSAIESIELYDMMGKAIAIQSADYAQLNISELAAGMYILKARLADGRSGYTRVMKH